MDNFFSCNHSSYNFKRDYEKGKSFRFSIYDNKDTYNNDAFVQDFVTYNQSLWACRAQEISNIPPDINRDVPENDNRLWDRILDGVSDIVFDQSENKIIWKYEDETEWRDLIELDTVSEIDIKHMLDDLEIQWGNTYDSKLSKNSTNAVQNKIITEALDNKADKTDLENVIAEIYNSDWNANEGEKGYIENKPFYKECLYNNSTIRAYQTIGFPAIKLNDVLICEYKIGNLNIKNKITVSNYEINIGINNYPIYCTHSNGFSIRNASNSDISITLYKIYQIDDNYIPDNIVRNENLDERFVTRFDPIGSAAQALADAKTYINSEFVSLTGYDIDLIWNKYFSTGYGSGSASMTLDEQINSIGIGDYDW